MDMKMSWVGVVGDVGVGGGGGAGGWERSLVDSHRIGEWGAIRA